MGFNSLHNFAILFYSQNNASKILRNILIFKFTRHDNKQSLKFQGLFFENKNYSLA